MSVSSHTDFVLTWFVVKALISMVKNLLQLDSLPESFLGLVRENRKNVCMQNFYKLKSKYIV